MMDAIRDNIDRWAVVEQHGEKIGQLPSVLELLVRKFAELNQLRNDPPPLLVAIGAEEDSLMMWSHRKLKSLGLRGRNLKKRGKSLLK